MTYKGPKGVWTPPGPALPPIEDNEDIRVGDEGGDGEPADNSYINNSLPHDAAEDNYEEMEEEFQRYEKEQEQLRPSSRRNYVELGPARKRRH